MLSGHQVPFKGQLAESLDYSSVGWSYVGIICIQVCAVSKQSCISGNGPLCLHGQGCGRDTEIEHGTDFTPSLPEHHDLAQEQDEIKRYCSL